MKTKNPTKLTEEKLQLIRKLSSDLRKGLGYSGDIPIGNDIFNILDNLNIHLLEYPIESEGERKAFSAQFYYSNDIGEDISFLGLNTADYYDKQIFAIAHELYHFIVKKGSNTIRLDEDEFENEANRFAAEFLLPIDSLKNIIYNEFHTFNLINSQIKTLLRLIARLQCIWMLPYRSLVRRLYESNIINKSKYDALYQLNERDFDGEYGRIGLATDKEVFTKLNKPTLNIGTSPILIDLIITNFENKIISEDELTKILSLFNKKPDDYGYGVNIGQGVNDEFDELLNGNNENEHPT